MISAWLKNYSSVLILGAIFFFALHRFVFPRHGIFETAASYITYPVFIIHAYTVKPIQQFCTRRTTNQELRAQLTERTQQLADARAEIIAFQGQLDFAKDTQEVRHYASRYQAANAQLAHVIAKQLTDQQHLFVVNHGSRDGIAVDMVAVYKNCLVGRVATVYPTYSKVQLITDKGCKISAYCATTKAKGIVEGSNNSTSMSLNFVSHLDNVQPNDLVISSGTGLVFPSGFMVGSVESIKQDGLYYAITVKPPITLDDIDYVYLCTK